MHKFLDVLVENLLLDNAKLVQLLLSGRATLPDAIGFCQNYRLAGIGALLLSGTSRDFRSRLDASGRAYAHFLRSSPEDAKLGSQAGPFFDALAAGATETAREIAQLARHSHCAGEEYEEDFLFPETLMQAFFLGATRDACEALLVQWQAALQGTDDPRLDACGALIARDTRAFDGALRMVLTSWEVLTERLAETNRAAPEVLETEGQVSVEGLALVRLAESLGMATEEEYPGIPSTARENGPLGAAPDAWQRPQG